MSLLREIEDAAVANEVALPVVLRKCRVLAARLRNDPLSNWVSWELDGYPSKEVLPSYRKARVSVEGHFSGFMGAQMNNFALPQSAVPEQLREALFHAYFLDGVASYEGLPTSR